MAAPAIFELFDAIERQAARSIEPAILDPVRGVIASILEPGPSRPPAGPDGPTSTHASSCVAFAEQFVIDVAATTDEQRRAMTAVMGADAFTFVQVLYVSDVFLRARIALGRLFDRPTPAPADDAEGRHDLWTMLEQFMRLVARRDALDPLTAELVRRRGARVHDCRLCRSRLSVRALEAAGGAEVFDEVDNDELARLGRRHQVALRLTDALVTQPSSIDPAMVSAVREQFTTDEIVEIVLDVTRNAANKIAGRARRRCPAGDRRRGVLRPRCGRRGRRRRRDRGRPSRDHALTAPNLGRFSQGVRSPTLVPSSATAPMAVRTVVGHASSWVASSRHTSTSCTRSPGQTVMSRTSRRSRHRGPRAGSA